MNRIGIEIYHLLFDENIRSNIGNDNLSALRWFLPSNKKDIYTNESNFTLLINNSIKFYNELRKINNLFDNLNFKLQHNRNFLINYNHPNFIDIIKWKLENPNSNIMNLLHNANINPFIYFNQGRSLSLITFNNYENFEFFFEVQKVLTNNLFIYKANYLGDTDYVSKVKITKDTIPDGLNDEENRIVNFILDKKNNLIPSEVGFNQYIGNFIIVTEDYTQFEHNNEFKLELMHTYKKIKDEYLKDYYKTLITTNINNDMIILTGYYDWYNLKGHAIALYIKKINEKYKITLFNSGEGINYHYNRNSKNNLNIESLYNIDIDTLVKILIIDLESNSHFDTLLYTRNIKSKLKKQNNITKFYSEMTDLNIFDFKKIILEDDKLEYAQFSGSCTFYSLFHLLIYINSDKTFKKKIIEDTVKNLVEFLISFPIENASLQDTITYDNIKLILKYKYPELITSQKIEDLNRNDRTKTYFKPFTTKNNILHTAFIGGKSQIRYGIFSVNNYELDKNIGSPNAIYLKIINLINDFKLDEDDVLKSLDNLYKLILLIEPNFSYLVSKQFFFYDIFFYIFNIIENLHNLIITKKLKLNNLNYTNLYSKNNEMINLINTNNYDSIDEMNIYIEEEINFIKFNRLISLITNNLQEIFVYSYDVGVSYNNKIEYTNLIKIINIYFVNCIFNIHDNNNFDFLEINTGLDSLLINDNLNIMFSNITHINNYNDILKNYNKYYYYIVINKDLFHYDEKLDTKSFYNSWFNAFKKFINTRANRITKPKLKKYIELFNSDEISEQSTVNDLCTKLFDIDFFEDIIEKEQSLRFLFWIFDRYPNEYANVREELSNNPLFKINNTLISSVINNISYSKDFYIDFDTYDYYFQKTKHNLYLMSYYPILSNLRRLANREGYGGQVKYSIKNYLSDNIFRLFNRTSVHYNAAKSKMKEMYGVKYTGWFETNFSKIKDKYKKSISNVFTYYNFVKNPFYFFLGTYIIPININTILSNGTYKIDYTLREIKSIDNYIVDKYQITQLKDDLLSYEEVELTPEDSAIKKNSYQTDLQIINKDYDANFVKLKTDLIKTIDKNFTNPYINLNFIFDNILNTNTYIYKKISVNYLIEFNLFTSTQCRPMFDFNKLIETIPEKNLIIYLCIYNDISLRTYYNNFPILPPHPKNINIKLRSILSFKHFLFKLHNLKKFKDIGLDDNDYLYKYFNLYYEQFWGETNSRVYINKIIKFADKAVKIVLFKDIKKFYNDFILNNYIKENILFYYHLKSKDIDNFNIAIDDSSSNDYMVSCYKNIVLLNKFKIKATIFLNDKPLIPDYNKENYQNVMINDFINKSYDIDEYFKIMNEFYTNKIGDFTTDMLLAIKHLFTTRDPFIFYEYLVNKKKESIDLSNIDNYNKYIQTINTLKYPINLNNKTETMLTYNNFTIINLNAIIRNFDSKLLFISKNIEKYQNTLNIYLVLIILTFLVKKNKIDKESYKDLKLYCITVIKDYFDTFKLDKINNFSNEKLFLYFYSCIFIILLYTGPTTIDYLYYFRNIFDKIVTYSFTDDDDKFPTSNFEFTSFMNYYLNLIFQKNNYMYTERDISFLNRTNRIFETSFEIVTKNQFLKDIYVKENNELVESNKQEYIIFNYDFKLKKEFGTKVDIIFRFLKKDEMEILYNDLDKSIEEKQKQTYKKINTTDKIINNLINNKSKDNFLNFNKFINSKLEFKTRNISSVDIPYIKLFNMDIYVIKSINKSNNYDYYITFYYKYDFIDSKYTPTILNIYKKSNEKLYKLIEPMNRYEFNYVTDEFNIVKITDRRIKFNQILTTIKKIYSYKNDQDISIKVWKNYQDLKINFGDNKFTDINSFENIYNKTNVDYYIEIDDYNFEIKFTNDNKVYFNNKYEIITDFKDVDHEILKWYKYLKHLGFLLKESDNYKLLLFYSNYIIPQEDGINYEGSHWCKIPRPDYTVRKTLIVDYKIIDIHYTGLYLDFKNDINSILLYFIYCVLYSKTLCLQKIFNQYLSVKDTDLSSVDINIRREYVNIVSYNNGFLNTPYWRYFSHKYDSRDDKYSLIKNTVPNTYNKNNRLFPNIFIENYNTYLTNVDLTPIKYVIDDIKKLNIFNNNVDESPKNNKFDDYRDSNPILYNYYKKYVSSFLSSKNITINDTKQKILENIDTIITKINFQLSGLDKPDSDVTNILNIILNNIEYFYLNLLLKKFIIAKNYVEKLKDDHKFTLENIAKLNIINFNNNNNTNMNILVILFEIIFGNFIRDDQYKIFNGIINENDNEKNYNIRQLIMGAGKSSVITPLVLLNYILKKNVDKKNIIIIIPLHLVEQTFNSLQTYIPMLDFTYIRKMKFFRADKEHKNKINKLITHSIKNVIIIDPSSIKSLLLNEMIEFSPKQDQEGGEFKMKYNYLLNNFNKDDYYIIKNNPLFIETYGLSKYKVYLYNILKDSYEKLTDIPKNTKNIYYIIDKNKKINVKNTPDDFNSSLALNTLKKDYFFIIDEIDDLLNPLESDLNYPISYEDQITDYFIHFIEQVVIQAQDTTKQIQNIYKNLKKKPLYYNDSKQENKSYDYFIKIYIDKEKNIKVDNLDIVKNISIFKKIYDTILITKKMKYNVDYGIGDTGFGRSNDKIAIPYSYLQTPINGASFSDNYYTIILTYISYLTRKLNKNNMIELLDYFRKHALDIILLNINEIFKSIITIDYKTFIEKNTDPDDIDFENSTYKLLLSNAQLILIYVSKIIIPKYITITKTQHNISFLDIISSNFSTNKCGYSGTVNIYLPEEGLYPSENIFNNVLEDDNSVGGTVSALIGLTDNYNKVFKINHDTKIDLQKKLLEFVSKNNYDVLIDAGAFFINYSPLEVIEELVKLKPDDNRIYIYVNKKDKIQVYNKKDKTSNDFNLDIKNLKVFIYYDNKHIIGIDVKGQPYTLKGLTTFSQNIRYTEISQAIFRLRNLNRVKGHSIDFISSKFYPDENTNGIYDNDNISNTNDNNHVFNLFTIFCKNEKNYLVNSKNSFKLQNYKYLLRRWFYTHQKDNLIKSYEEKVFNNIDYIYNIKDITGNNFPKYLEIMYDEYNKKDNIYDIIKYLYSDLKINYVTDYNKSEIETLVDIDVDIDIDVDADQDMDINIDIDLNMYNINYEDYPYSLIPCSINIIDYFEDYYLDIILIKDKKADHKISSIKDRLIHLGMNNFTDVRLSYDLLTMNISNFFIDRLKLLHYNPPEKIEKNKIKDYNFYYIQYKNKKDDDNYKYLLISDNELFGFIEKFNYFKSNLPTYSSNLKNIITNGQIQIFDIYNNLIYDISTTLDLDINIKNKNNYPSVFINFELDYLFTLKLIISFIKIYGIKNELKYIVMNFLYVIQKLYRIRIKPLDRLKIEYLLGNTKKLQILYKFYNLSVTNTENEILLGILINFEKDNNKDYTIFKNIINENKIISANSVFYVLKLLV